MTVFYIIALIAAIGLLIFISSKSKEEVDRWFNINNSSSNNSIIQEPMKNNDQGIAGQTIIINQVEKQSNGIGTAGFILALISLFLGWVPTIGWIIWFLGFLFSFIGIFKAPRGMAIAGLIISLIVIIFLIVVFGAIFSVAALS